ncbi:MAG: alpha/beta hydrolase [Acetobacteraceae bacterium]|nr:alpha/beta hydrolase [Acetobacteraceae bacterium]MBV8524641.1 alpha/beta hydrolase [Acetobacteraceae bacterium]
MALDPDAQRVLDIIRASGRAPFETMAPAEAREAYAAGRTVLQPEPPQVAVATMLDAGGVPVRLYRGLGTDHDAALPCLVFLHGGGWVVGDCETHDGICRTLANYAQCCVVSAEYRLAPEFKFPAAVDDSASVLHWVARQAGMLRIDAERLAVGGDSAGGNLAAVLALMSRDGALPPVSLQLLLYPAVDLVQTQGAELRFTEDLPLTTKTMAWFIEHYLSRPSDARDWRASPLRASQLEAVAPAFVLTAGYDPLCDEAQAYARRLEHDGGQVTSVHFAGQMHGFLTMGRFIRAADTAVAMAAAALRTAFS